MTKGHVSRRDKETALRWEGMTDRQAMALREKLNSLGPGIEAAWQVHRLAWENLVGWMIAESVGIELVTPWLGRLVRLGLTDEMKKAKEFVTHHCEMEIKYHWYQLTNAVLLAGTSHTGRTSLIEELARTVKRHKLVESVMAECIAENKPLRGFTKNEQNDFLYCK